MNKFTEEPSKENLEAEAFMRIKSFRLSIEDMRDLIDRAKKDYPEEALAIRNAIRPLVVEMLYVVIGTPTTIDEDLKEIRKNVLKKESK